MEKPVLLAATIAVVVIALLVWLVGGNETPSPSHESSKLTLGANPSSGVDQKRSAATSQGPADGPKDARHTTTGEAEAATRSGTLRGTLLVATENGKSPLASRSFVARIVDERASRTLPAQTNARGYFQLKGLRPGSHQIEFDCSGFVPYSTTLPVASGRDAREHEIVLRRGIRVWGRVRDVEGKPAPDSVVVWRSTDDPPIERETLTGSAGEWELTLTDPGRYEARVAPTSLRSLWSDSRWQVITVAKSSDQRFDLTADIGKELRVVVSRDSEALAGVSVSCRVTTESRGASVYLAPTDARGVTRVRGLPATGTLVLELEAIDAAKEKTRVEVRLDALPEEVRLSP